MPGLHGLEHDAGELLCEGVEFGVLAERSAESLERALDVVVPSVEAPVDQRLDA